MSPVALMKLLKVGWPFILLAVFGIYHLSVVHGLKQDVLAAQANTQSAIDDFQEYKTAAIDAAARRLQIESAAVVQAQADFERQLQHERELRSEAHRVAEQNAQRAAMADDEIERLKNENENVRNWADGLIPVEWIDWMHDDIDIESTDLPTG